MAFLSQHHSFDISLAAEYGIECAILIHHFQHWIRENRQNGKNIRDGKCWTYQSRKEISARYPYLNYDQIKYICEKLVSLGILVTGNFNKAGFDKTLWYAFVDEKKFGVSLDSIEELKNCLRRAKVPTREAKVPNGEGKSAHPIPDTKTDTEKQDINRVKASKASPSLTKEKFIDHVHLTKEEHEKLLKEYGSAKTEMYIKKLDAYVGSKGKKYKSHYKTILTWILNDELDRNIKPNKDAETKKGKIFKWKGTIQSTDS